MLVVCLIFMLEQISVNNLEIFNSETSVMLSWLWILYRNAYVPFLFVLQINISSMLLNGIIKLKQGVLTLKVLLSFSLSLFQCCRTLITRLRITRYRRTYMDAGCGTGHTQFWVTKCNFSSKCVVFWYLRPSIFVLFSL